MMTRTALLVLVLASGCAHTRHADPVYACGDGVIAVKDLHPIAHGSDGAHFAMAGGELVAPDDPRADAMLWQGDQLVGRCVARGGYTDVLSRYMAGESYGEIADDLGWDNAGQAKNNVRKSLQWLRKQSSSSDRLTPAPLPTGQVLPGPQATLADPASVASSGPE